MESANKIYCSAYALKKCVKVFPRDYKRALAELSKAGTEAKV